MRFFAWELRLASIGLTVFAFSTWVFAGNPRGLPSTFMFLAGVIMAEYFAYKVRNYQPPSK